MKTLGIVRSIDPLGRICLPKELRRIFNIQDGDPISINVDGNTICLEKYCPEDRGSQKEIDNLKKVYGNTPKIINKISELESIINAERGVK